MKKSILLFVATCLGFNAFSQLQVSTVPQNKNVLLEEFTGIHCVYCPDGHKRANDLKTLHGSRFWVVNIHVGGYATPGAGEPDFRTPFGTAISGQSGLTGYPAGTINRHLFSGMSQGSGTAMSRGNWAAATTQALAEPAYVNIAVEAQVDVQTRQLRVITQYYYTDTGAVATNKLNIALLQDKTEGPQTGGSNFYPQQIQLSGNYTHNHMLRHLLTGQWGQDISNTNMGSTDTDTFYYTVPAALNGVEYDLGNLEIVAFITEGQQEVANATGTDVTAVNHANAIDAAVLNIEEVGDQCPGTASQSVWVKIKNVGGNNMTSATLSYSANGGTASTYNWTGNLAYGESEYVTLPAISFTAQANNTIDVEVTNVNSTPDPVSTNNTVSTSFDLAGETLFSDIVIKITCDRYGSETSWTLKNSGGTTVSSGGPYTDAAANGAYPQPDVALTLPNDCYTFEIEDSYGDGMCCSYGNGKYEIWANGAMISGMTGASFEDADLKKLTINTASSVAEVANNNFRLFPNPASSELNISFEQTANNAVVNVVDLQGRVIMSQNINNVTFHQMNVADLTNGVYMVVINADGKTTTEKITVLK